MRINNDHFTWISILKNLLTREEHDWVKKDLKNTAELIVTLLRKYVNESDRSYQKHNHKMI